ncbi:hypothetical protein I5G81_gp87 [Mycobacterium phage Shandong1]|uniref:Uncharacterized protein n=1 Tax=Mycobacterium phage Shandong1 TaxID=1983447 RepID=A0A1X9SHI1_9CAUD|nr:hypothetical protein I5G81_gp87 [Mycobacterium phage Shandong1]ARQ95526.1 hypothetical protein [Mycobacterium phage Shandong1]
MGSASVLFLDGPLAGQTREVPQSRIGSLPDTIEVAQPRPLYWQQSHEVEVDRVTYRRKPNRLARGPKWAAALGDKVGEQMVTVLPYDERARECVGADEFDAYVVRHAHEAMRRHAEGVGLVAAEVHEVWRGTRADAAEQMAREGKPVPHVASLSGDALDGLLASTVFVVHEAVAMPADSKGVMWE